MKLVLLLAVGLLFHSCFFDNCKKQELTLDEKSWFKPYHLYDTIIFKSDRFNLDSLLVNSKEDYFSKCNKLEIGPLKKNTFYILLKPLTENKDVYSDISIEFRKESEASPCLKHIRVYTLWGFYESKTDIWVSQKIRLNTDGKEYMSYYFEDNETANSFGNNIIKSFNWSKKYGLLRYEKNSGEVFDLLMN